MATAQKTIIDMLQLDQMAPGRAVEIVDRMGKLIFRAVLIRSLPLLPEGEMAEYQRIVAAEGPEEVFKFLNKKIPNFPKIVQEETDSLKKEIKTII